MAANSMRKRSFVKDGQSANGSVLLGYARVSKSAKKNSCAFSTPAAKDDINSSVVRFMSSLRFVLGSTCNFAMALSRTVHHIPVMSRRG